jgi:Zn-dependent protease
MSIKIGRFFGINLFIHWSFWLLPLWVAFMHASDPDAGPVALHLALLGALFGCVVLHEYGHALTARFFGIATRDVTLYPIGGVARLERMSERPAEEFCIAIAGPLVNLAIAAVLGTGLLAANLVRPDLLNGLVGEFWLMLVGMNVLLFLFNLLPAFPMDGGRVLRALLTAPLGRLGATRVSVYISIGMAVLFCVAGVQFLHNPSLVFIGVFVILTGLQELAALERLQQHSQEHGEDASPHVETPAWSMPSSSGVTVYVWDGRKHAWIAQGVVPAHPFHGANGRPVS